jgi:hypothetical protein
MTTESANTSADGLLILSGFTGNPRAFALRFEELPDVRSVSHRRSGNQIELTITMVKDHVTTPDLRDLVDMLVEYDVRIQGVLNNPIATLVVKLTPAKVCRRRFSRTIIQQPKVKIPTVLPRLERPAQRVNPISSPDPLSYRSPQESNESAVNIGAVLKNVRENENIAPTLKFLQRLFGVVFQLFSGGFPIVKSAVELGTKSAIEFTVKNSTELAIQARNIGWRTAKISMRLVSYGSIISTLLLDNAFGKSTDDDSKNQANDNTPANRDPKS